MELAVAFTRGGAIILRVGLTDCCCQASLRDFWMDRAMMHACKVMDGDDMLTRLSSLHVLVGALGPSYVVRCIMIRFVGSSWSQSVNK